jgi:anti-sigma regulatory factor (Ser/Thr protein kinase)
LPGLQLGYIARMSGASAAGDSAAEGGGRAAEVWFTVPQPEEPPPETGVARPGESQVFAPAARQRVEDDQATVVRLEIPTQTRIVRAARLVASGLASTAGFDVDDVDDMRIAVDELCAVMFELGSGGVVSITFATRPGEIEVHGQTTASGDEVDPTRIGLSLQILHAACDEFSWTVADGVARVRIEKRLRRQDLPGGAVVRRFPAQSSVRRPRPS